MVIGERGGRQRNVLLNRRPGDEVIAAIKPKWFKQETNVASGAHQVRLVESR